MESESDVPDAAAEGALSRRALLRGAAVGGALAWAAPTVQVIAPPAFAAGSVAPALSYVGLLLRRRTATQTTYYRVKYEFNTPAINQEVITVEGGPTWESGGCLDPRSSTNRGFYRYGKGLPLGGSVVLHDSVPPSTVVTGYDVYNTDGGFYAILAKDIEFLDWMVHKGNFCGYRATSTKYDATCQPATPGGLYKTLFLQYVDDGARSGNQWMMPASPNSSDGTKLGTKAFPAVACVSTSVTGTPRH